MVNALSFDVEDYYKIVARDWLSQNIPVSSEVVRDTEQILDILRTYNVTATFFIVGDVAQQYPELIRKIANHGHELGIHGHNHFLINTINNRQFDEEIKKNINSIEKACGIKPRCHRAPAFSLKADNNEAIEVLSENGILLDSSLFPFSGSRYGSAKIPRKPYKISVKNGTAIWEMVLPTCILFGRRIPIAGGGYLRIMPCLYTRWAIKRVNRENIPVTVYMHSYEIGTFNAGIMDVSKAKIQDKIKFRIKNIKQQVRRKSCKKKLVRLLEEFNFTSCGSALTYWQEKNKL